MRVHLDFETRSCANPKRVGAVRHAMDGTTEVLCAAYKIGEADIKLWRKGDPAPRDLIEAVALGYTVVAHNALFELAVWTYICEPTLKWGRLSVAQMDCTMARAQVMSLASSLGTASTLLRVGQEKDKAGHATMLRLASPRKARKGEEPFGLYWNDNPEDLERLYAYCIQDVNTECALDKVLPKLSPSEQAIYHFDLTVNFRGFRLDTVLMRKAQAFLECATARVNCKLEYITEGEVPKATQLAKLKSWLASRGIEISTLAKGDVDEVIAAARAKGDSVAEEAVGLRRLGAKATSLSKYRTGLGCVGFDERARGLLNYHKASTGRWAGSLYQPHNLERIDAEVDAPVVDTMINILSKAPDPAYAVDWCELLGLVPMQAIGKCTRAMIVAAEGCELIGCDYSNVEGRGSAWLAGEQWKVQAFRDYDEGTGPDLYKLAYSKSFGEPVESIGKGSKRQIGKVQELSLGYQGGVGAFMSMGADLGVKPDALLAAVKPNADLLKWEATANKYQTSRQFDLTRDQWTAFRYVVDGWRAGHPRTVQCWWDLQDAVVDAVSDPGSTIQLLGGKVRVYCASNRSFLYIYLPSGRPLSYFKPTLRQAEDKATGRLRRQVVVEGWDSRVAKWGEVSLYGGLLWENVVQGMCRDLLAHGMMNCEKFGYPVVLHVHDEGVFEVPENFGSVAEVQSLMSDLPKWARGFPLTSAAWRDKRYVK